MSPAARAILSSWSIPFWPTVGILFLAVIYSRGWRTFRALNPALFPAWRLACFWGGLASLWFAIASPLEGLHNLLLSAHMCQHLLLMLAAPPLLLLGAPQVPLLRGLPRALSRDALGPFLVWPPMHRLGRTLTNPAVCWLAAIASLLLWHVPTAYDRAIISPFVHEVEHACFLGSSLLFWWPVIQPWPSEPQWPRWTMAVYLFCAGLAGSVLAAFLCFADRPLYPVYAEGPKLLGLNAVSDQVAAGAIMWVFGSLILLGAAVGITIQLLGPGAIAASPKARLALPSEPARHATPAFDLLQAPIVGWFLRARYGRRTLQVVSLMIAIAVMADGFVGHPMASMNLAGVIPWTYGRALVLIALLAAGNFFCMACPFMLPRELGRRLKLATRNWPRVLRNKWLAAGSLALFFWAYQRLDLSASTRLTAWILAAYFAAAFTVDAFFRGASFCKYVCPIGQFNFVSSLVSPLEVKVRRDDVCRACKTQDCLRGNDRQRGCELNLFLPAKNGGMDCTACLDCVKSCPHDNVGMLIQPPARTLLVDPVRSSAGRFSRRPDIAILALVVSFSAFANAAQMVIPSNAWRSVIFPLGLVIVPTVLVAVAAATGRWFARSTKSTAELFCRFSFALLPLALTMWTAHLLFHLSTGWDSVWPVIQRAAGDIGVHWLGSPVWMASASLVNTDTLLSVQALLLDAGGLLSLYIGWRVACEFASRTRNAFSLFVPWAVIAGALYVSGIWILLQPMEMLGMVHG